ncbi:hypothetical protein BT96DRAFT_482863 [Gymnopus androsaceus JB14]|uniref:Uncharacterized protein n=1 Tax=Gymnopus androsaceus JB14 TaxID=1447944 RepID=A0A6A4GPJ1_9AGAR|nr:hypothetical protein BT96DRAFT_482863 [Gymnopus androsaceus JB14]
MVVLPLHAANHAQFYLEAMSSESTRFLEWGYILFQVTCDDHKLRSVLEEVIRLMENLKVDQINDSIENRAAKLTIELDKLFTVEIKYFWIDWALELFRSSTMRSVPFRDVPFRLEVQSKVSQPGRNCWDLSKFPTIMDLDRREQYNYSKRFLASHAPGSEIGSLGRVCLELAKRSPFTEIEDPWLMSRDGLRWPTMAVLPIHAAYHAQFYLEAMAFEPTRFLECEEHIRFQVQCDDHKLRK